MKKYIYVSIAVAVCWMYAACSTLKERSASHQRHITAGQAGSTLYQSQYDSTGQYWHFWSDSLFYYHPDSGLYAFKGALAVQADWIHHTQSQQIRDSSSYALDESSTSDHKSTPVSGRKLIGTLVILIGVVFLIFSKPFFRK